MDSFCNPESSSCPYWNEMHRNYVKQEKLTKDVNVVLIGASIIECIQETQIWRDEFLPLDCVNYGISGERVENLIYRLENGALDYVKPKVIAYMIGSNNVDYENSDPDDIAAAIFKVAKIMRSKQPNAHIVSMSIPPKGEEDNFTRDIIHNINDKVEALIKDNGDAKMVYLRCSDGFINANNGSLDRKDYSDWIHFTENGYKKYCRPLINIIKSFLLIN